MKPKFSALFLGITDQNNNERVFIDEYFMHNNKNIKNRHIKKYMKMI